MQSMASSVSVSHSLFLHHNPLLLQTFPSITPGFRALKIDNNKIRVRSYDSDRQYGMRKPSVLHDEEHFSLQRGDSFGISEDAFESSTSHSKRKLKQKEEQWLEWEDQILEETVPLVSFVRMILHSGKYESGGKLSPEHEKTILDKLLSYHPECEKKIGCGIDFITVGYHPDFENSRCLFIVRKDGKLVDFSYWKCIKGLIRKNYPLYADSFILRHFRRGR